MPPCIYDNATKAVPRKGVTSSADNWIHMTEEELNKIYVIGIGLRRFKRVLKKIRREHPDASIFVTPQGYLTYISPTHAYNSRFLHLYEMPVGLFSVLALQDREKQRLKELQLCRSFVIAGMPKNTTENLEERIWEWAFTVKCPTNEKRKVTLQYRFEVDRGSRCEFTASGRGSTDQIPDLYLLDLLVPDQMISAIDGEKYSRELQKAYSKAVLWTHGYAVFQATGVFHPLVNAK